MGALGARVIPNRFDLAQEAGTTETYSLILEGDQAATETLRLYLGDWERREDGEHDWGIPVNGARWSADRTFAAGETFLIQYRVTGGSPETTVSGTLRTSSPQWTESVAGAGRLDGGAASTRAAAATIEATRRVDGDLVTLEVSCRAAFQGLVITETYSAPVSLAVVEAAAGAFDTVERSCTNWVAVAEAVVQVRPGEKREVAFVVTTPVDYEGSYWTALFVEAPAEIIEQGGTRVLSIPRTAIKIFVTAPGTESVTASVTAVSVLATAPLIVSASVLNSGNVEVVVTGIAEVIDRSGAVVRQMAIAEAKVLPGAARLLTASDASDAAALASGIYQVTVRLEYGGEGPVVGVRGFRVP